MSLDESQTGPWFVPYLRDPHFTGRAKELAELHGLLQKGAPVVVRAALDMGPGGSGATHLAIEYAYRHRAEHPGGVYWASPAWDGSLRRQLSVSLDALAHRVGLIVAPPGRRAWMGAQRGLAEHLAERPGALLIVEDVDDPDAFPLRPQLAGSDVSCRMILLSRRRSVALRAAHLDVGPLEDADARSLLHLDEARRGGELPLVRALGHLPLALALAASHLGVRGDLSLDAYLADLVALGAQPPPDSDLQLALTERHKAGVSAVITASWGALDSPARRAVAVLALLGPGEHVPRRRFEMLSEDDGALAVLLRVGLVEELAEGALRIHPEVRAFVLAAFEDTEAVACACVARLAEALQDPERLEREVYERDAYEVASDLYAGQSISKRRGEAQLSGSAFYELLCLLEEAGPVGWERARIPGMLMQNFRRYFAREPELVARADAKLAERRLPHLRELATATLAPGTTANAIVSVAVTADGRCALTAAKDGCLTLSDLPSGRARHTTRVTVVPFLVAPKISARGMVCLVAPHDGGPLSLWDLTSGRVAIELEGIGRDQVWALALSQSGRFAAAGTNSGAVLAWDLAHPGPARVTTLPGERAFNHERRSLAVTDDGRAVLAGTEDGRLVFERRDGARVERAAHLGKVTSVVVTHDDHRVMTGGEDGALKLWDLDTAELISTYDDHPMTRPPHPWMLRSHELPRAVNDLALTDDGRFAVVTVESRGGMDLAEDNSLTVWDLRAGCVVLKLPMSRMSHIRERRCAVSPDASIIALSGGGDLGVVRWVRWDGA